MKTFIDETNYNFSLNMQEVEKWTHATRLQLYKLDTKYYKNDKEFGKIQSCFYTFEDSQSVIEDYKNLEYFDSTNAGYLKLYGLFQAFFIQQDSLYNLYKNVCNSKLEFNNDFQGLYEIRTLRNITTGHPTDRKGEYYLISQITFNKYGYQLISYRKSGKTESIKVNIYDLLNIQDNEILLFMKKISREIENDNNFFSKSIN